MQQIMRDREKQRVESEACERIFQSMRDRDPSLPSKNDQQYFIPPDFSFRVFFEAIKDITSYAKTHNKIILSIGPAGGMLEEYMRQQGCLVEGLEPEFNLGCPYETPEDEIIFKGHIHRIDWNDPTDRTTAEILSTKISTIYNRIISKHELSDMSNVVLFMIMPQPERHKIEYYGNGMAFYLEEFVNKKGRLFASMNEGGHGASELEPYNMANNAKVKMADMSVLKSAEQNYSWYQFEFSTAFINEEAKFNNYGMILEQITYCPYEESSDEEDSVNASTNSDNFSMSLIS
jgi:hypothetical protein